MTASLSSLAMFAKYWQPGAVKTRLARAMGVEPASCLARAFVSTLVRRLAPLPMAKEICFAPPERRAEFAALAGDGWSLTAQSAGDLGDRLRCCLAAALDRGAGRVVIIGSDSPNLPREFVEQAFEELRRTPVVLGPSEDGGYYLVGIAGDIPSIFCGIAWSTPHVWPQTVRRLEELRLPFARLPAWYDVDRAEDLERLRQDLAGATEVELQELRRTVDGLCRF